MCVYAFVQLCNLTIDTLIYNSHAKLINAIKVEMQKYCKNVAKML